MKTRKVYLLKDDAFTAAQTRVIDVNVVDPISSIDIIIEMTNGATMVETSSVKPHDEFTKIEVVDGSNVLVSASMEELQALNFAELGVLPLMELTLDDDDVQREACHIMFGLDRNDPNHYLVPANFNNLQIRITNTLTTPAADAWAASGHLISVIANVIEEGEGSYEGFLTAKSMYQFTAVDGSEEVIDMPRDYPYRLIMIQSLMSTYSPALSIEKLKLSCDADKYVPIDIDTDHLLMENAITFGKASQVLLKRITGAGDIYGDLYHLTHADAFGTIASSITTVVALAAEKISVEENTIATA